MWKWVISTCQVDIPFSHIFEYCIISWKIHQIFPNLTSISEKVNWLQIYSFMLHFLEISFGSHPKSRIKIGFYGIQSIDSIIDHKCNLIKWFRKEIDLRKERQLHYFNKTWGQKYKLKCITMPLIFILLMLSDLLIVILIMTGLTKGNS